MKSSIDNSVNLAGTQTIEGLKTFETYSGIALKVNSRRFAGDTQVYSSIGFYNQNKEIGYLRASTGPSIAYNMLSLVDSNNNYHGQCGVRTDNGTDYNYPSQYCQDAVIDITANLNAFFTATATGMLCVSIQTGSQTNATVNMRKNSSTERIIAQWRHNGGTSETTTATACFPCKKGERYYLQWNNAGTATVSQVRIFPWNGL